MPDLVFFYSAHDPSVAFEALRLGYNLLVNKSYYLDEELIVLSEGQDIGDHAIGSFYILPETSRILEISMDRSEKCGGAGFKYIRDRVGAAAVILSLNNMPAQHEVSVGSLEFHTRTYRAIDGPLEPRPEIFSAAFRNLRSFIKRSAQPISNEKFPKTVYIFPNAMALLREDFSRSPWPSLKINDSKRFE